MIPVDLAPEVLASLRRMRDAGVQTARCHKDTIRSAIAGAVRRLVGNDLVGSVRPWDLPALERGAAALGEVSSARAVHLDDGALVAELQPGGQRILFRGIDDDWRLVRFVDGSGITLRPETTRRVELRGWGPDSVLTALGIVKPDGVELDVASTDLGQGETKTVYRYQWSEGGRSIVAEEVKTEIFDGATPYSTYVRGVIVNGDRGVLLTGKDGSAVVIEG